LSSKESSNHDQVITQQSAGHFEPVEFVMTFNPVVVSPDQTFLGDAHKLLLAFRNILHNSIKFSKRGFVVVSLSLPAKASESLDESESSASAMLPEHTQCAAQASSEAASTDQSKFSANITELQFQCVDCGGAFDFTKEVKTEPAMQSYLKV
jgi:signal transduction histidine kinase